VDATKVDWQSADLVLLPQTRRHSLLLKLLRVPTIIFAINKLDAVDKPELAFMHIAQALQRFADEAAIDIHAMVPMSALKGWNVVSTLPDWCGYSGPSLLSLLENVPVSPSDEEVELTFAVQWVEKFHDSATTSQGRRVYWGRVATGVAQVGDAVRVFPSGQLAMVKEVLTAVRLPTSVSAGHSAGIVLDREVDLSRGDWLVLGHSSFQPSKQLDVTVAWLDDEPLVAGRAYWALHGHQWVKAKVASITDRLDIHTLESLPASELPANAIGRVQLSFQQPLLTLPYGRSRTLGSMVLVDTASHKTSAAVMVQG